jgi:arylsulfatase A-like enzyme
LVIFTNDNGAPHYADLAGLNAPLRGWKATYFEGGIRVPLFMRWPAGLPAGARVKTPVGHVDIFSTVAAAAGRPLPTDRVIDGVDLLPFARGERGDDAAHRSLYWRTDDYLALREGDWKLQVTQRPRKDWLYDLAADPGERRNLAASQPERLAAMKAALAEIDRQQSRPLWRTLGAGYIPLDKLMRDPQSPDDEYVYFAN